MYRENFCPCTLDPNIAVIFRTVSTLKRVKEFPPPFLPVVLFPVQITDRPNYNDVILNCVINGVGKPMRQVTSNILLHYSADFRVSQYYRNRALDFINELVP